MFAASVIVIIPIIVLFVIFQKQFITETEHRIAELEQQVEKGRDIDV